MVFAGFFVTQSLDAMIALKQNIVDQFIDGRLLISGISLDAIEFTQDREWGDGSHSVKFLYEFGPYHHDMSIDMETIAWNQPVLNGNHYPKPIKFGLVPALS